MRDQADGVQAAVGGDGGEEAGDWARPAIWVSDAVQMIALAAFVSVFCFLTLYVQNVAGFSPIRSGSAYLPSPC